MASETRSKKSAESTEPRAGARTHAAPSAPTAPHAGDAPEGFSPTGPSRFWGHRRTRIAFGAALVVSLIVHFVVSPFTLLPDTGGLELKDVDDELVIPIEMMATEMPAEAPKPIEAPTQDPADPNGDHGSGKPDAAPPPKPKPDASAPKPDASADGGEDASDAGVTGDAGDGDGGVASSSSDAGEDASSVASGVRDGGAPKVGFGGLPTAGVTNVKLLLNVALIRQHPVGSRMGPLLNGIPQWADFMKGTQQLVDPVRDADWMLIYGPSLIHTEKDAIFLHYGLPDAVVDQAIATVTKKYDKGGPYDAGVPGVQASLGHADQAERVFLRAQPHEAAVVPPAKAHDFALLLKQHGVDPGLRPGEAMRLSVRDPYRQVAVPGLKFPESMTELRLYILPRADGGAEVFAEGECKAEADASDVADVTKEMIARQNASVLVRIATRGLLNNVEVKVDGKIVKAHLTASREQMEGLLQTVAAQMGVQLPAATGTGTGAGP